MAPVEVGTNRNKLIAALLNKGIGSVDGVPIDKLSTFDLWVVLHDKKEEIYGALDSNE